MNIALIKIVATVTAITAMAEQNGQKEPKPLLGQLLIKNTYSGKPEWRPIDRITRSKDANIQILDAIVGAARRRKIRR